MDKFRKKPVVIEAVQWRGDNFAEVGKLSVNVRGPYGREDAHLEIETLEGRMRAGVGDWLIRGVAGEVYPCKPDIFDATYEQVQEDFFDAVRADPEISPVDKAYWLAMEPRKERNMEGLTEGRIVHFVLDAGRYKGEHRAAVVVKVWRNGDGTPPENGVSNLTVFTDAANDDLPAVYGRGSVLYDAEGKPGTWHWIEKA